ESHSQQEGCGRQQHRTRCCRCKDELLTSRCQDVHITHHYHSHHHHHHHHCSQRNSEHRQHQQRHHSLPRKQREHKRQRGTESQKEVNQKNEVLAPQSHHHAVP